MGGAAEARIDRGAAAVTSPSWRLLFCLRGRGASGLALRGSGSRDLSEISLAADRNNPFTLAELSICKFLTSGSDQEAIALTEGTIRLSPRDPSVRWWYTWIGFVHLLQARIDEAIAWLEKGRRFNPRANPPHWFLAADYGFKGERELARAE